GGGRHQRQPGQRDSQTRLPQAHATLPFDAHPPRPLASQGPFLTGQLRCRRPGPATAAKGRVRLPADLGTCLPSSGQAGPQPVRAPAVLVGVPPSARGAGGAGGNGTALASGEGSSDEDGTVSGSRGSPRRNDREGAADGAGQEEDGACGLPGPP